MKKIRAIISAIALIAMLSITVNADATEFIDYCKENHTVVNIDSEYNAVTVGDIDKLWNDRTIITETEIAEAEAYNNENEDKMYYSLQLKVVNIQPYTWVKSYDSETKVEKDIISKNDRVDKDASLSALCAETDFNAYRTIELADSNWYVVSIEKHLIRTNGQKLISAACNSLESYTVTFKVPSYYEGCEDLKLAKISNGQVSYMEDIDTVAETFTITANGSASYVFAGTRVQTGTPAIEEIDKPSTDDVDEEPTPTPEVIETPIPTPENPGNNSGKVTAPQTSDSNSIMLMLFAVLLSGGLITLCYKNRNERSL